MTPIDRRARRASLGFVAVLALILFLLAAADPSGLFAPLGYSGGHPVAALWWWSPYAVFLPVFLGLAFWGGQCLLWADPASLWVRLLRLWGVAVGAALIASTAAGVVSILEAILSGRYVLPLWPTLRFIVWSSGYAGCKVALFGWIAAMIALYLGRGRVRGFLTEPSADAAPRALLLAVATLGILAVLAPWLTDYWWTGSPLGYTYVANRASDGPLVAPVSAGDLWGSCLGLLITGAVLARLLASAVARPGLSALASASIGFSSGVVTAAALWLFQAIVVAFFGTATEDHWHIVALIVRGTESLSFGVVLGFVASALTLLERRIADVAGRLPAVGRLSLNRTALVGTALVLGVTSAQHRYLQDEAVQTAAATTASPATPVQDQSGEMLPLTVADFGHVPAIVDAHGAKIILRGFNVNQLGSYYQADPRLDGTRPLAEQDFIDMRALGSNVVRLTFSWSELEPAPGAVSSAYMARIRTAVDWAKAHGLYVLIDLHQDAWGQNVAAGTSTMCRPGSFPMTGWDGAPAWATLTDGTPACAVTGRDLAPNVSRAFQSFYLDRNGVQTRLLAGWAALGAAFAKEPAVVGFDLLNEPNFGDTPPVSTTLLLANYYARATAAIRRGESATPGGFSHLVFVEPSIIWSGFGLDNLFDRAFLNDPKVVFSPHLYNESITADQDFGFNLISIERGYALASAAAAQLHAPLWIGEWGFFQAPGTQTALVTRQLDAETARQLGSAFWVWKQACGDPHAYPAPVAGDIRRLACPAQTEIETPTALTAPLSRPYARLLPGPAEVEFARGRLSIMSRAGSSTPAPAPCSLEAWRPGDRPPRILGVTGIALSDPIRIAPGAENLGPSGGWVVHGCVTAPEWELTLD